MIVLWKELEQALKCGHMHSMWNQNCHLHSGLDKILWADQKVMAGQVDCQSRIHRFVLVIMVLCRRDKLWKTGYIWKCQTHCLRHVLWGNNSWFLHCENAPTYMHCFLSHTLILLMYVELQQTFSNLIVVTTIWRYSGNIHVRTVFKIHCDVGSSASMYEGTFRRT